MSFPITKKGRRKAVLNVTICPLKFESLRGAREYKAYMKELFEEKLELKGRGKDKQFQIEIKVKTLYIVKAKNTTCSGTICSG